MNPYVDGSIIHGGQDMQSTKVTFKTWLDKEDVVHTYYGSGNVAREREHQPSLTPHY